MRLPKRLRRYLSGWVGYIMPFIILAVGKTLRWEIRGEEIYKLLKERKPVILAFWHNRIFLVAYFFRKEGIFTLISPSRDGEIISRTIERMGNKPVRGSSSKGGALGLRKLVRAVRAGAVAAITPDGPRGPKYTVQPGIFHLARMVGGTILPVSWAASKALVLPTWDNFIVPLPFSKVFFAFGESIEFEGMSLEEGMKLLQERLMELTRSVEHYAGIQDNRAEARC